MKRIVLVLGFWLLIGGPMMPGILYAQIPGFGSQQQDTATSQQILSLGNGRYVFGQISDSDKDRFMLDTQTGRLWRISESGKIGLYLNPVPYKTGDDSFSMIPEDIPDQEAVK